MADPNKTREEVKALTDRLEAGIQDLYTSDKYAAYLNTLSKFHNYSTRNTMLIHLQKPDASQVAGFNTWKNNFERHVLKGEKGIRIFAPAPFVMKKEMEKLDPDTQAPLLDKNGKPIVEEVDVTIPAFKPVSVFDVSQTNGKPLPNLAEDLTSNVQHYEAFLDALKAVSVMPIGFEALEPNTDGVTRYDSRAIAIREGMSEAQTISAIVHEMTHAELHDYNEKIEQQEQVGTQQQSETNVPAKSRSRRAEEVEAESVSYVVCQHYGIETGANSFGYVVSWSKGKELDELKASLEIIRKSAASMIDRIDGKFAEICKERGIDLTPAQDTPEQTAENARYVVVPVDNDFLIRDTATNSFHGENGLVIRYTDEAAANETADKLNRNALHIDAQEKEPQEQATSAKAEPESSAPKRTYFITERQREQAERMAAKWEARAEAFYAGGDGWGQDTAGFCKTPEDAEKDESRANSINMAINALVGGNGTWADVQVIQAAVSDRDELDAQVATNQDISVHYADIRNDANEIVDRGYIARDNATGYEILDDTRDGAVSRMRERIAGNQNSQPNMSEVEPQENAATSASKETKQQSVNAGVSDRYSELQHKGFEIAQRYEKLPLQDRMNIIAETFGCKTASIRTSPCTGKWRGSSDISLDLDNGASLFIGNYRTPEAKTSRAQNECVNAALAQYNPEILAEIKARTVPALLKREAEDNTVAAQKGLKPYTFLNIEMNDGSDKQSGGYLGWYYATVAVDGKIFAFIETGLSHDIARGILRESRPNYFVAGALKDNEVDFVFNNVGHSSTSGLYKLHLSDNARERAEKTLNERIAGDTREKQYDLGFGHMGNGLTVWNRLEEKNGDYVTVAHIDPDRTVTFYDKDMPDSVKAKIEQVAITSDMTVSATQDTPVFSTPAQTAKTPALEDEVVFLLDDSIYLHIYEGDEGYSYNLHGKETLREYDGGFLDKSINDYETAYNEIIALHELTPKTVEKVSLDILDDFTAAWEQPAEVEQSEPEQLPLDALPDPAIGLSERDLFGYTDPAILPLLQERALELYDADHTVYMLYPDGTEAMAFDRSEIETHDGIFGIEAEEWQESQELELMKTAVLSSELLKEAERIFSNEDKYSIYQLKDGDETRDYRFEALDRLEARGLTVDRDNYELVYTAPLADGDTLDSIYQKFNIDHPADFRGHSLSMSDVVVFQQGGQETAHYVDRAGFKEVPEFSQLAKAFDLYETTDLLQRLCDNVTKPGMNQAMGDSAFDATIRRLTRISDEIPETQSALKSIVDFAAESTDLPMLRERMTSAMQQINPPVIVEPPPQQTGPTVAELEAQVKAGQTISLFDLAKAVKNEQPPQGKKPARPTSTKAEKPSILAQLQEAKKATAQAQEQQKAAPKRDSNREV